MQIIHIFKDYYPIIGGIENHIKILAEFQVRNGFDVTILTTSRDRKTRIEIINSVKVIKASRVITTSSTPVSFSLFSWLRRLPADITHLHFPYPVGEFAHLLLRNSKHTVVTYHSDIVKQRFLLKLYKPFLLKILQTADRIIATSPQFVESSPFLNKFTYKCEVVPYGIDLKRFSNPNRFISNTLREKFNNSPIIMFVGRLRSFKGLVYLFDAMKAVDATLLIIGDGSEKNRLRTKASEEGLESKIFFLGEIPYENLPEYYDICDVFVLPSSHRNESFGIVLIEAMASGNPVISTELGTGTSFINIHEKTGLVVPPRNSKLLANAINRLLRDDSLRRQFALNARNRAKEFSSQAMNERILKIYRDVHVS